MTEEQCEVANQMRIALVIQIDELVDVAERHKARMWRVGNIEEAERTQGAINYALNIAKPYRYNGPYKPDLTV